MTTTHEIVLLVLLLIVLSNFGVYFYYLVQCYSRVKEGRKWIFLTPLWLIAVESFNEDGNRYRVAALKTTAILIVFASILLVANEYR